MSGVRRVGLAPVGLLIALTGVVMGCEDRVTGLQADGENLALAKAGEYSAWTVAKQIQDAPPGAHENFNTEFLDGCPFPSRDGKMFFMASTRPRFVGDTRTDIDIWVSTRASVNDPWGEPVNVGAPINSEFNDFCPTLARDGHTFYFVSNRPGGYGGTDIYITRFRGGGGIEPPRNLGAGVNSSADEASPFPLPEPGVGPVLYFSSARPGGFAPDAPEATVGDSDIYRSESHGGVFGPAELVPGVNSEFEDGHPNVRRDALEIFFYSNRPGVLGMADIYSATRGSSSDAWSTPVNLGPNVNSDAVETRPSLSWDGTTLYFGSTRPGEGSTDIYVTTRMGLGDPECGGFCFLPPLAEEAPTPSGDFAADASPTVLICEKSGDGCGPYVAGFGSTFGANRVRVDMDREAYEVRWNTRTFGIDSGKTYRTRVYAGGRELGHIDTSIEPGSTVPIRFRIEEGGA